jgi:thioredoxin-like negative regulator of GroEL
MSLLPAIDAEADTRPLLLFFTKRTSGPARRMASLVAWIGVSQKRRVRVCEVDVEAHPVLARRLGVSRVPTVVLLKERRIVGRLEGRATGGQIQRLIEPHVT